MQIIAQAGEGPAQALAGGNVDAVFVAEFHTGILDELEQFKPTWVGRVGGGGLIAGHPAAEAAKALDWECARDKELLQDQQNTFLRSFLGLSHLLELNARRLPDVVLEVLPKLVTATEPATATWPGRVKARDTGKISASGCTYSTALA